MNLLKSKLIIFLTLVSGSALFGQELLTLEQAVNLALEKNHQIQIARNTAEISENNLHVGNAGFLPKLDLTSAVNYTDGTSQSAMGAVETEATTSSAQLEASYNLFNGFADYFSYRKLEAQAQTGELSARSSIESTLLQVISSYYADAAAEDALIIAKEALEISKERLQRAEKKSAYGQANKLDLLNAQVDLNSDSVSYLNTKQNLTVARQNLLLLLGIETDRPIFVVRQVNFAAVPSKVDVLNNALQKNADYLIKQQDLQVSEYDLKKAQATHLPSLNLRGTYGYSQYADGFDIQTNDPNRSLSGGLSMSFNIFDGFKRSTQTQNAKISVRNNQILKELSRLNLEKSVTISYNEYINSRDVLAMTGKNLESAELNFDRTKELYNNGQLTSTQFREAQLNLIRAKNNLSQAKYQAKNAEAGLQKLAGTLLK